MTDVTRILTMIHQGDPSAADRLLPIVYDELRQLATQRLSHEKPGQTLQGTALVHEAYLRLVDRDAREAAWDNRRHFFAAAAEAMRRILVDAARRKKSVRAGGDMQKVGLTIAQPAGRSTVDLIELNDALDLLAKQDRRKAELVKLRYFAGLTIEQAAETLGVSVGTANNDWAYAKTWLRRQMA
jgi:RNA polymerase sigma factor (TIGR02999 family)